MESLKDTDLMHVLHSQLLGSFDYTYMGVTLQNLRDMETEVHRFTEELRQKNRDTEAGTPDAQAAFDRSQFESGMQVYWRIRAHEKVHYYQQISTSVGLAKTFSVGDSSKFIFDALKEIPEKQPVGLPLYLWAMALGLADDENMVFVIKMLRYRLLCDLALDGRVLQEHFDPSGKHYFKLLHPELDDRFWETEGFRLGFQAIAEGSAKASEWLYFLQHSPDRENEAIDDIYGSPEIYVRALEYLRKAIPGKSLRGYLQALAVLADLALHPRLTDDTWPFIYLPDKEYPLEYFLPGARFVRLVEALRQNGGGCDFEDKYALFERLVEVTDD